MYQKLVKNLIIDKFDNSDAFATSKEFFNKDSINFVAVDGTEYAKQFFDIVIFYAGAYSCSGTLDFIKENGTIKAKYEERFLEKGREISSCVPVYINKIPDIDTTACIVIATMIIYLIFNTAHYQLICPYNYSNRHI